MALDRQIIEERISLPVTPMMNAGLHRFTPRNGEVKGTVLMLHGLMQGSDVFFDQVRGGGLAYYLAEKGYDVFVCQLRGRDASNEQLKLEPFGLKQVLQEDLPLIWSSVEKRCRHQDIYLVGYQFGSLLWSAMLARQPELLDKVRGILHFCPQRALIPGGKRKNFWYDFLERSMMPKLGKLLGFVPSQRFKIGKKNESLPLYSDALQWRNGEWKDQWDGFDYLAAMENLSLPPSLYFVTLKQAWRGLEHDCRAFMFELGHHNGRMIKLGSKVGNKANYARNELCTHLKAEEDYFPLILEWMKEVLPQNQDVQAAS